ncbi:MAG: alkylhydroperoxidase-related (seleno)protein, partial [Proteobacteria bacterium]|nr:alkylhydroperoxidase-related (seleno)protein [Pseudomonadota bacterium]
MSTAFSSALKNANLAPRADLIAALDLTWQRLAEPGEWLTGAQRLAVAQATRDSWNCPACVARKASLSPFTPGPDHTSGTGLDTAWIDLIHFTTRDSGRMTGRVFDEALSAGMLEDEFVEIISVAIETQAMDAFAFAIGLPQISLPEPVVGEPPRVRTEKATPGPGWVPTVAPENASPDFADWYDNGY